MRPTAVSQQTQETLVRRPAGRFCWCLPQRHSCIQSSRVQTAAAIGSSVSSSSLVVRWFQTPGHLWQQAALSQRCGVAHDSAPTAATCQMAQYNSSTAVVCTDLTDRQTHHTLCVLANLSQTTDSTSLPVTSCAAADLLKGAEGP